MPKAMPARLELASLVLLAALVFLLGRALQVLAVGVAYGVWTGIGGSAR